MDTSIPNLTIEAVDRAIRDWFDKTVNSYVKTPQGQQKVHVQFSQGERWAVGRTKQAFRDENGVLILPIIAVRRSGIAPDPTKLALGTQTPYITVAREVDPKTNLIRNLEAAKPGTVQTSYPAIFDVLTIPFPDRLMATYQVVIQAQFIGQMNSILQKMWRSLDIQKSFVAPLLNDGRLPPRLNQYGNADPYEPPAPLVPNSAPYVVGFMETNAADGGNFEEFTDQERIVKYSTEVTVPFALLPQQEGQPPVAQVQRTSYKLVLQEEVVTRVDNPADLDKIFGPRRR